MEIAYGLLGFTLLLTGWTIRQTYLISKKMGNLTKEVERVGLALFGKDPDPKDGVYPIVNTLVSIKKDIEEIKKRVK